MGRPFRPQRELGVYLIGDPAFMATVLQYFHLDIISSMRDIHVFIVFCGILLIVGSVRERTEVQCLHLIVVMDRRTGVTHVPTPIRSLDVGAEDQQRQGSLPIVAVEI